MLSQAQGATQSPSLSTLKELKSNPDETWSDWGKKVHDSTSEFFKSDTYRETSRILRIAFNKTQGKSLKAFKAKILRNHTPLKCGQLEKDETVFMAHMKQHAPITPLLKLAYNNEFLTDHQAGQILELPKDFKREGQYYSESGSEIPWKQLEGKLSDKNYETIIEYLTENISDDEFRQFKNWTLVHMDDVIKYRAREIEQFEELHDLITSFSQRRIPITRLLELLDKGKYLDDSQVEELFSKINLHLTAEPMEID